jgi:hypothetical protein
VHHRVEAEGARQEVHPEVEPRAGPQQVLDLLVRLGPPEHRVDLDQHQLGDRQAERAGQLADQHLGDQHLAALAGAAELHDVRPEVVGLHHPGQRAALAQRHDVPGRGDGAQRLDGHGVDGHGGIVPG